MNEIQRQAARERATSYFVKAMYWWYAGNTACHAILGKALKEAKVSNTYSYGAFLCDASECISQADLIASVESLKGVDFGTLGGDATTMVVLSDGEDCQ